MKKEFEIIFVGSELIFIIMGDICDISEVITLDVYDCTTLLFTMNAVGHLISTIRHT